MVVVRNAAVLLAVREDEVGSQILKEILRQLVLLQLDDLLESTLCLLLLVVVIHEHLEAERIIFILSDAEAIVS